MPCTHCCFTYSSGWWVIQHYDCWLISAPLVDVLLLVVRLYEQRIAFVAHPRRGFEQTILRNLSSEENSHCQLMLHRPMVVAHYDFFLPKLKPSAWAQQSQAPGASQHSVVLLPWLCLRAVPGGQRQSLPGGEVFGARADPNWRTPMTVAIDDMCDWWRNCCVC